MQAKETWLNQCVPTDYEQMMRILNELAETYPCVSFSYLGETILGRGIPMVTLGKGKKTILYVGAHHGMEWITSWLLLRMISEYCQLYENGGRLFNCNVRYLYEARTLCIVPMLNPDGVNYQIHGVDEDHILYRRLLSMNEGSSDFSRWQANARGVDLNHNYNAGFAEYKKMESEQGILGGAPSRYSGECPESEPEVGHLCNYIRYHDSLQMVISLHTQGEEIYYTGRGTVSQESTRLAERFAQMCGYRLGKPEGMAAYGGLTDWCVEEMALPAFTVECGKGNNPLPISERFGIYTRLRRMLFSAPMMV